MSNEQQLTSSLNNIENIKSKSKINDEEIIICRSPPSVKKVIPSQNKNRSKTTVNGNSTRKTNIQQVNISKIHVHSNRTSYSDDILRHYCTFRDALLYNIYFFYN